MAEAQRSFEGGGAVVAILTCTAVLPRRDAARDEVITAVRDALAYDQIGGPTQVTTVRLLDSAESRPPAT